MDPPASSSSKRKYQSVASAIDFLETSMNLPDTGSTKSDELVAYENDLKDVACVVFSPTTQRSNVSVYLVDLAKQKLRGFAHLDCMPDLPLGMANVVYKSKLYMFGGFSDGEGYSFIGPPGAYVLDLAQLARADADKKQNRATDNKQKAVVLKSIPDMKAGKAIVRAVLLGDKICVFDFILGHNPPDHNFEIFDPQLGTWCTVPDPFVCERGHFVDGVVVKDSRLFISIRKNTGVYELHLGANASPTWIHHPEFHGAKFLPVEGFHTQSGSLLFTGNYRAYDFSDKRGFTSDRKLTVDVLGETVNKEYEVWNVIGGTLFDVGDARVCSIRPVLLSKTDPDKSPTVATSERPLREFLVLRKCRQKKKKYRFVVSMCRVDRTDKNVCLNVGELFTVPMDYWKGERRQEGCILTAALCDH